MTKNLLKLFWFLFLVSFIIGFKNVQADVIDSSANVAEEEATPPAGGGMPSAWNNPPQPPVGGFRISINNDAKYADSLIVNLTLFGGPDTKRMAISNFSDFKDASQETYQTTKIWSLCQGLTSCLEGEYTVYAKFYTDWGAASELVSDRIIYTPKESKLPTGQEKLIAESVVGQIQTKINEISRKIADLKNQIAQLFKKEVFAEVPETPLEEIVPLAKELPKEEIVLPPTEIFPGEGKTGLFELLKGYITWHWQPVQVLWNKIWSGWQKIWPF